MPEFNYIAMDRHGARTEGTLEAESLSAAAQAIRAHGQVVVSIREKRVKGKKRKKKILVLRSVRQRDVAEFCRRLSTLLKAGVGVVEGLDTIGQAQSAGHFQKIILKMAERIRSGYSLSEAMKDHPETFPPIAGGMVSAAEASGELPAILVRLAEHIEKRLQVRENILMAVLYPCIVLVMTLVVLVVMVVWVFPRIAEFLHHHQKVLPVTAQALIDSADFLAVHGLTICIGVLAFILLVMMGIKTQKGRLFFHRTLLELPVLRKVFRAATTQMWSRTLSDLLQSGVALQESLRVTSQVVPNRHFSGLLARARDEVIAGTSFGESLKKTSAYFDNLVCKMVVVGENSGTLEEALEEVSRFAEEDLNRRVTVLSKLFEPTVIVFVGVVVGFVFITFFQTVYAYI